MSIDVFFCTKATSDIRKALGLACLARWDMEPGIRLRILMPDLLVQEDAPENVDAIGSVEEFDKLKLAWAEFHAASSIYVIAEDDWLPEASPFVERIAEAITKGIAVASSQGYGITFRRKGKDLAVCAPAPLHISHGYQ